MRVHILQIAPLKLQQNRCHSVSIENDARTQYNYENADKLLFEKETKKEAQ